MPFKSLEDRRKYNRLYQRKYYEKMQAKGLCARCYKPKEERSHCFCQKCLEVINKRGREFTQRIKVEVIRHYGGECTCCGEQNLKFLTIDHINNDGKAHRKVMGRKDWGGRSLYLWLRKNNYPLGFQVQCFNCNLGRSINGGICPHKEVETSRVLIF